MFEEPQSAPAAPGLPGLGDAVDCAALRLEELVDVVASTERLIAQAHGLQMAALAEMARRPIFEGALGEHPAKDSVEAAQEAAALAGVECNWSRMTAENRVDLAVTLESRLSDTLAALRTGRIDLNRARAIADATENLEDDMAAAVEQRVLPRAERQTTSQLRASLRRAVLAVDPDGAERRHQEAVGNRRVEVRDLPDGVAELIAPMRADHAEAIYARLTEIARRALAEHRASPRPEPDRDQPVRDDDPSMDSLRADALVWLTLGEPMPGMPDTTARFTTPPGAESNAHGHSGDADSADAAPAGETQATPSPTEDCGAEPDGAQGASPEAAPASNAPTTTQPASASRGCAHCGGDRPRPLVSVVVPVGTLLGLTNEPAELAGYGPIPASLARELAADGTWRRILTDPATGATTAMESRSYRPPENMSALVRARDGTCRFPGCRQPAARTDLDHVLPWPHGKTCPCNLCSLCRFHHLLKTHHGWKYRFDDETGEATWTSPIGRKYTTAAEGILTPEAKKSALLRLARLKLRRTG